MKFCEELRALHGHEALLQGLDRSGLLFQINNVLFRVIEGKNEAGNAICTEIQVHEDQDTTIRSVPCVSTAGVRVVLDAQGFTLFDLFVDVTHLRLHGTPLQLRPHAQVTNLDKTKPWPQRGENRDFIGVREYDMLVGEMAGKLKGRLQSEAAARIALKKQIARKLAAEEKAAFVKLVQRDDLGEDNPVWGNW